MTSDTTLDGSIGAAALQSDEWAQPITKRARRLSTGAALLLAALAGATPALAEDPIKIGSIFDLTGDLNIYGIPQSRGLQLAVDKINADGGLLGRKVEIVETDAQSQQAKYTQYANTLLMRDHISALFAGLTSSAREAIRPIARRANIPYFYSSLYEGGACDKQTFITGPSASQQLSVLIPWAIKTYGRRLFVMAPDYNFGTISTEWIKKYAADNQAEVVGTDILPLTVTDYSPTIQKIQVAKPDVVVALPVGANQTGFLEQFAASGLKQKIALVSTNYGSGNQQIALSVDAARGIVVSPEYVSSVSNPQNEAFKRAWQAKFQTSDPIIGEAVDVWNAALLWASAVKKAGTIESDKVIAALESGLSMDSPNGAVTLDARSHHLVQSIFIAKGNDKRDFDIVETHDRVAPSFEQKVCDLIAHPQLAKHFTSLNDVKNP
jgi:urea transport system substrate-binding protein